MISRIKCLLLFLGFFCFVFLFFVFVLFCFVRFFLFFFSQVFFFKKCFFGGGSVNFPFVGVFNGMCGYQIYNLAETKFDKILAKNICCLLFLNYNSV